MGEMVVGNFKGSLPVMRPTIVTSTYKEPFPGWIESVRYSNSISKAQYNDWIWLTQMKIMCILQFGSLDTEINDFYT